MPQLTTLYTGLKSGEYYILPVYGEDETPEVVVSRQGKWDSLRS